MMLLLTANSERNMYRRCCFIYLLVLLIDTASLHRLVEGVEGGSVVLLCSKSSTVLEEKHLTVHWRHNDTRNVYDIIQGEVSVKEQDPAYKNRAEVLSEELKKGQIFLKLTDLKLSDRGTFLCFVPDLRLYHSTQLVVKERPVKEYRADYVKSHGGTSLGRTLHILLLSGFILHFI
ncbi:CD276 antigen homolog [Ctenopharyngodon idella]|uniref:CD276 antigen homolog n=1 Tax=Ctenopharyngodon idella TaxID=7959 RepID=UPI002231B359|nr:CD276 antigen homolog [Ctenopharyngodon idella]